jgi:hypothetical protein
VADTKVYSGLTAVMQSLGPPAPTKWPVAPARWSKVALRNLSAVEELLDWLENNGFEERELEVAGGSFVVRWR